MECAARPGRSRRMGFRACCVLVLLPACFRGAPPRSAVATDAPPPRRTAIALSGHYRSAHEIRMVCDGDQRQDADGWCKETVEDTLRVRELANGSIEVAIELVSTNAHTCSFEGTLERTLDSQSARRWRFDAENDEEFPCSLVVEHARGKLTVTSEGCREYCGARATLDAVFDVRPRG